MSNNKYELNLHYNTPGSISNYNPCLTYKIGNETSLYGSLPTHGCYSFIPDGNHYKFSFFVIYPERTAIPHDNGSVRDSVKFVFGAIKDISSNELEFKSSDDGKRLILSNGSSSIQWPVSVGLDYQYQAPSQINGNKLKVCKPGNVGCTSIDLQKSYNSASDWKDIVDNSRISELTIPESDIKFNSHKAIEKQSTYKIKAGKNANDPIKIYRIVSHGEEEIGELKKKTLGIKHDSSEFKVGEIGFNSSSGLEYNGLKHNGGDIIFGDNITLDRSVNGNIRFSIADHNFCVRPGADCRIDQLNIFPNIKTYLRSTLTAADISNVPVLQPGKLFLIK
ncbi:MAG: hypothetical protein PG981_000205 [Wolbachia endosymbiont of Ctenocephalides orientis wCori]|nr:MAG: hypothetical protein PG981_000205 [Wolbachia endosymbiont of Ctenocephalides orientis wCori]